MAKQMVEGCKSFKMDYKTLSDTFDCVEYSNETRIGQIIWPGNCDNFK